ncbi:uncharacterized protein LOC105027991 isoform X1 [Esox lucius]|uniref:uncharacterized protein LOC105027991 isoform X1 n=2 Tax=Esox lucius TaxID=8010 RepID=UPI00147681AB|nr:uncharacterized protein LOC105027991 isoform X1 [Esox lucius]
MDLSVNSDANGKIRKNILTKRKRVNRRRNISPAIRKLGDTSNDIPLGRQLYRTPPMSEFKKPLCFSSETQIKELRCSPELFSQKTEEKTMHTIEEIKTSPELNVTMELYTLQSPGSETCRRSRITSHTICSASVLEEDPYSLIRGMEGYEVTPEDLVFIKSAKQKQINHLQMDDLLNGLRNKIKASREMFQADLDQILSCEQGGVLALDSISLLAQKNTADVQHAVREEQAKIAELEDRLTKVLKLREERQRNQEMGSLNKQIFKIKGQIDCLKVELSELNSQLAVGEDAGNESLLAMQGTLKNLEDSKSIKHEEDLSSQELLQVAPSRVKAVKESKRRYGKTSTRVTPRVRNNAENILSTVGTSDVTVSLRRSSRIAKKSCVETKPVLRQKYPNKERISHEERVHFS